MSEPPSIGSRTEFGAAVRWGFEAAIARNARQVWCSDRDFADWPLSDASLLEQLSAWLRLPQRQLVLLAENYDELVRCQPRFVGWRRTWSHAVQAWSPADNAVELPTVLVDDGPVCVRLTERLHWRGRAALDAHDARLWRERTDAILQQSASAFPVNQLGL